MKILNLDRRKKELKVVPENLDDLWVLSQVVDVGDTIRAVTERKIKLGNGDERKTQIIKKKIVLDVVLEKIEFHKYTNNLRLSGKILEGKEDISSGSYHTITIEPGMDLSVRKKELLNYQVKKIEEHSKKRDSILICTLDRGSATIFRLFSFGYEIVSKLKGNVQKKDLLEEKASDFFVEVSKALEEEDSRNNYDKIVVASPQFWHTYLQNSLSKTKINSKVTLAVCNAVGENGIKEILSNTELKKVLQNSISAEEISLVEELLENISKDKLATYGLHETENAANMGAIKDLLLTDKFVQKTREEGKFLKIENIIKTVESTGGKVHIISFEHEGGKKLNGLGGIASIKRY
ncbi:mRNA surveillance protein pelota [Candidatus Woesearchaeota archaeon]|nr:mRNA surveillance protein pelota [Candidatus Woesearchaeota archaeon]